MSNHREKGQFNNTVSALMEASGLDKETSEEIVEDFCGHAVKLMASIKQHLSENNLEEARILLHQLKGSAGNVRAKEIATEALEAERAMKMMNDEMLAILLARIEQLVEDLVKKTREEELNDEQ